MQWWRIVVVGGAGDLELATVLGNRLGRKGEAEILLVDKYRTHIWKPLLPEVVTGTLDADLDGVIYSMHAVQHGYRFELGEMIGLDCSGRQVVLAPRYDDERQPLLPERAIAYDRLVLA